MWPMGAAAALQAAAAGVSPPSPPDTELEWRRLSLALDSRPILEEMTSVKARPGRLLAASQPSLEAATAAVAQQQSARAHSRLPRLASSGSCARKALRKKMLLRTSSESRTRMRSQAIARSMHSCCNHCKHRPWFSAVHARQQQAEWESVSLTPWQS